MEVNRLKYIYCGLIIFIFGLNFYFLLFLGMVIYDNDFEIKEKQELIEIKN